MKNLIAISAVALTAGASHAAVVATTNYTTWQTGFQTTYVNETFYTDTLGNAVVGGTPSGTQVTGGHGWGVYTLTPVATTALFSLSGSGAGTSIVSTPTPGSNDNVINFNFADSGNMYGIAFTFFTTNNTVQGSQPRVTAYFVSESGFVTSFTTSGGNIAAFYSTANERVLNVEFSFDSGAVLTISDIELGLVPAPGAIALVGVAGLVGSRRRRA